MAGRTSLTADKSLQLLCNEAVAGDGETWVTLFTTAPTVDAPTGHGGVEWGPPRKRVFPNSAAGTPYWSAIDSVDNFKRRRVNAGSVQWSSIVLTVSPSIVVAVGIFGASTGGNLQRWYWLTQYLENGVGVPVADGQAHAFGSGLLWIQED